MVTSARNPKHFQKEKTRSITYRLPEMIVEELETEASRQNISQNVLVKQILEKYIQWDKYSAKIGVIPVPKAILDALGNDMTDKQIDEVIKVVLPMIKDAVMFIKGGYDLKRCIEILEDYMRATGMKSDHRIEGNLHHYIIQHELGMTWSRFTEHLLKEIFHMFEPDKELKCQITETTVIATIALGSDFSEHDY